MQKVLNFIRQHRKHLFLILALILIAGLAESIVTIYYNKLLKDPIAVGNFFTISPVYNERGSWYHAKIGIGYIRGLLIIENIAALLMIWFLYYYLNVYRWFFGMRSFWLYVFDFAFAPTLYRFFHDVLGIYTLDYIRIVGKRSTITYDFPDFYLFISAAGILAWFLIALIPYYKYKHTQVKGIRYLSKIIWELKLSITFIKAVFVPRKQWPEFFDKAGFPLQNHKDSSDSNKNAACK